MERDEKSVPKRPSTSTRTGALRRMQEVLSICARARAAAQHYEELKPQSDANLAQKGLTRADLPRAAYRKLTGQP
jgi:hypothetical protein